jgi:hypothetical protein
MHKPSARFTAAYRSRCRHGVAFGQETTDLGCHEISSHPLSKCQDDIATKHQHPCLTLIAKWTTNDLLPTYLWFPWKIFAAT